MAESKSTHNPEVTELITSPESQESHDSMLEEIIELRSREALDSIDFIDSPEVKEAVVGYFNDHYSAGEAVRQALAGEGEVGEIDDSVPHAMKRALELLQLASQEHQQNPDSREATISLIKNAVNIGRRLFTESSLGVVAVNEEDKQFRRTVCEEILAFAQKNNLLWLFSSTGVSREDYIPGFAETKLVYKRDVSEGEMDAFIETETASEGRVFVSDPEKNDMAVISARLDEGLLERLDQEAERKFWNDVRHASYLEFHGTGVAGDLLVEGMLSRNEQIRRKGAYYTSNMRATDGKHHSNVPKLSEFLPSGEYTGDATGSSANAESSTTYTPATIGIPIADVVKVAPFARNAEFAVVRVRELDEEKVAQHVSSEHSEKQINVGSTESAGTSPEFSLQRGFFARPDEVSAVMPDEYEIPITGMGASGDIPASTSRLLITYSDRERWPVPLGYQFPQHVEVESRDTGSIVREVQQFEASLAENPRYAGRYVVPLRRGVFSFMPEESDSKDYPHTIGNQYTRAA